MYGPKYFLLLAVTLISGCFGPPDDNELKLWLESHRAAAEILIDESKCPLDGNGRLWRSDLKDGACLNAMHAFAVSGLSKERGGLTLLLADSNWPSYQKGFYVSVEQPSPLYESLDVRPPEMEPYQRAYSWIGGNWYVYAEYVN